MDAYDNSIHLTCSYKQLNILSSPKAAPFTPLNWRRNMRIHMHVCHSLPHVHKTTHTHVNYLSLLFKFRQTRHSSALLQ